MSNHYDPHYDDRVERESYRQKIGNAHKATVAAIPPDLLVDLLDDFHRAISGVEEHVIGATAVDRLRRARDSVNEIFRPRT